MIACKEYCEKSEHDSLGRYYMDSIILVKDTGGSISPRGTDQFPPLMSWDRWCILSLKSKSVMTHQKQTVEIVLTATQELGCGATFGMTILILLAAHTWTWNDIFSLQNSFIAHRLQTKYFSLSESNSCIIICCWFFKYFVESRSFKMATSSARFWLKMESSSFSSVWLFAWHKVVSKFNTNVQELEQIRPQYAICTQTRACVLKHFFNTPFLVYCFVLSYFPAVRFW